MDIGDNSCFHANGKIPNETVVLKIFCKALLTAIGDFLSNTTEIPSSLSVRPRSRATPTVRLAKKKFRLASRLATAK